MIEPDVIAMSVRILTGDCREVLAGLPDASVQMVCTSPPYYGLREYGTATWEGGDLSCDHVVGEMRTGLGLAKLGERYRGGGHKQAELGKVYAKGECPKCGALRIDKQIGLEPTPAEYVEQMVAVFREVRRVLRDDGTVWLNLGDSYASGGGSVPGKRSDGIGQADTTEGLRRPGVVAGYKSKDLIGIPWRVAFALQQPFYAGRIKAERDRVWMAAMIDAEGTICGFRHERQDGNVRTGSLVFVTNSSKPILVECDRIWSGARYIEHQKVGEVVLDGFANKECFRWQIQGADDRSLFLREIYPYLIEKRQQAIAGYAMAELSIASKKNGRNGDSADTKAKRDVLTALMSDLNQGRPYVMPSWLKEPPGVTEPGWYLRSDVIWSKSNPMPESVTDRPTSAHEHVFLLTKREKYFFDAEAVREPATSDRPDMRLKGIRTGQAYLQQGPIADNTTAARESASPRSAELDTSAVDASGRNCRNVWTIATSPYPDAHFATFPPELAERCIKAGTSERGCCANCGAPWARITTKGEPDRAYQLACGGDASGEYHGQSIKGHDAAGVQNASDVKRRILDGLRKKTFDWKPSCSCDADVIPCTVLDPFGGAGTTGVVADSLNRSAILIELNPTYAALADRRIHGPLFAGMAAQ